MDGWTQRLLTTLVLAVIALLVSFLALFLGVDWRSVAVMSLSLFAAMVTIQLVTEMRRDLRLLKNQALELSGYESEIGRRVDYLASLIERSGGAAPDELAKRVRAVNHQYATLTERLDRLEEDVAEIALSPRGTSSAATASSAAKKPEADAARPPAAVIAIPRPGTKPGQDKSSPPAPAQPAPAAKAAPVAAPAAGADGNERKVADLRSAVAGDRLAFHLLPVLSLPERTPAFYEALMRLKDDAGGWIEGEALDRLTRPAGLASLVERKTLYTAAQMLRSVRRMGKEMRLLAPLSTASIISERGFDELRQFLEAAPDLRDALVLEITQANFRALTSEARQRIGLVADAGFTLSLGDMKDARTEPDTLRQLGFTLARAGSSFLTGPRGGETPDGSLAVTLASYRIDLVATNVGGGDTTAADELAALMDRDVTLAQGVALSAPRLVKPDLLRVAPQARTASARPDAVRRDTAHPNTARPDAARGAA